MVEKTPNTVQSSPPIDAILLFPITLIIRPALTRNAPIRIISKPFFSFLATSVILCPRSFDSVFSSNMITPFNVILIWKKNIIPQTREESSVRYIFPFSGYRFQTSSVAFSVNPNSAITFSNSFFWLICTPTIWHLNS